jgi:hypothetical protein
MHPTSKLQTTRLSPPTDLLLDSIPECCMEYSVVWMLSWAHLPVAAVAHLAPWLSLPWTILGPSGLTTVASLVGCFIFPAAHYGASLGQLVLSSRRVYPSVCRQLTHCASRYALCRPIFSSLGISFFPLPSDCCFRLLVPHNVRCIVGHFHLQCFIPSTPNSAELPCRLSFSLALVFWNIQM